MFSLPGSGADPLGDAAGFVDQLHTLGGEFISDSVGIRVILRGFGGFAGCDGRINGAVVQAGGLLRAPAQIYNGVIGSTLWSETGPPYYHHPPPSHFTSMGYATAARWGLARCRVYWQL